MLPLSLFSDILISVYSTATEVSD